ncbi:MAG: N-sulfoglucosamine sulfohydrolase [Pseudoalteromonas tetraodonis]|jgi:N-sulfoglucosamine sulfohydrolase
MRIFLSLLACFLSVTSAFAAKPNVLIIMADDCTFNDLPLYGGKNAKTPNIDRLAREGLTFDRAYLAEAMCQPCRSELFTGRFPMRNGCAWNHSASKPEVESMPQRLAPLGYRVGISGKLHVKPQEVYPFEKVKGFDPNCVRNPTKPHDTAGIEQFMGDDEPFCLVVALVEPHVPWVMGDASAYPPGKLQLPTNIADTKVTREAFSRYLAEITYMDGQVGEILGALEKSGKASNTLVLFTSEQGSQFPGCKWTNWDTGVHTALVARWPGEIAGGKRSGAMVQYADVLPTLIHSAGGDPSGGGYDGSSFLKVLRGESGKHRDFVYGVHNNLPEGPSYPVRSISNGEFRYLENLKPDEIYIEKHLMGWQGKGQLNNPYWATWVSGSATDDRTYQLVKRYMHRPAEELYQISVDPYEMTNLADETSHEAVKLQLRRELRRWMKQQGDPGAAQDSMEALEAARKGEHLYGAP